MIRPSLLPAIALLSAVSYIHAQTCATDVIFVFDSSGSITDEYEAEIAYVEKIVDGLDVSPNGVRVAGILFNGISRVKFTFDDYLNKDLLKAAIRKQFPSIRGITNAGKALIQTKELLKDRRSGLPLSVVVIHDGFSWDKTKDPADALRGERDTRVMAAGVVEPLWLAELERIADSSDLVFIGSNSAAQITAQILSGCVPREPVRTPPPATRAPVTRAPATRGPATPAPATRAPPGPTPAPTTTAAPKVEVTGCVLDLLFVMDASGSIENIWEVERKIAQDVVDLLTVGVNNAHVGLVRFAGRNKVKTEFGLLDTFDKADIRDRIGKAKFIGGTTDIAGALSAAEEELVGEKGRKGAPKIMIIFSDGYSFTDPVPVAERIRSQDGVIVFALAIQQEAYDEGELARITGTADNVFTDKTFDQFEAAYRAITSSCRNEN